MSRIALTILTGLVTITTFSACDQAKQTISHKNDAQQAAKELEESAKKLQTEAEKLGDDSMKRASEALDASAKEMDAIGDSVDVATTTEPPVTAGE